MIDNAPYHSKNTENYPTSKWRKQQFVDWLTEKNVTFPDKALRAELWTLVKSEREKFPDKVMETVAKEYSLDSVEKLFRKKREELPEDFWRKCVEHVKKIEENYWESDRIQDNKVEQLRRVLFIVRAGVAKNTKIQCTRMKLLIQPAILATCQKSINSF